MTRSVPASRSSSAPGYARSVPSSGACRAIAMALTVKSRRARSSSSEPARTSGRAPGCG